MTWRFACAGRRGEGLQGSGITSRGIAMKSLKCTLFLIVMCLLAPGLPAQTIDTIAGKIPRVDGVPARQLPLVIPRGVAVDANGYVYITDAGSCTIRRIDAATGLVTVVAGGGTTLDDFVPVPAKEALIGPQGMAFDSRGNLYFANVENHRVRLLTPDGKITTVAGGGYTWDWEDIGDGGKATEATLAYPKSVAFDRAGNLYIADAGNEAIRKVDAAGIITTIAGGPYAMDTSDNIPAAKARLIDPSGITFDSAGNLYFADYNQAVVRKIDAGTGLIRTIAGTMNSPGTSGDGSARPPPHNYSIPGVWPWPATATSTSPSYTAYARLRRRPARSRRSWAAGNLRWPMASREPTCMSPAASGPWPCARARSI